MWECRAAAAEVYQGTWNLGVRKDDHMTTTRGLLQGLGLTTPAAGVTTGGSKPGGPAGPTGPLKAPNYDPPEEVPGTKKKALDDAELGKALKNLPADPPKRAEALADLVTKVSDAARRDPIVRALRDVIAKIQPIMSDKDAKEKIDKAISDLVDKGVKEGIMQLLKAAVGKEPTKVDRDAPRQDGPNLPEKDLGEHILKTPPIDLPFDKPPKLRRGSFEFVGLSKSYKAWKYIDFKVRTPDSFEPYGKAGAGQVVIAAKDDFDKTRGRGTRQLGNKRIEKKGEASISMVAPEAAGRYVIYIVVGLGPEDFPTHEFDVTP